MDFDNMIEEFGTYIAELKNYKSYLQSDSSVISTKLLGGIRTEHIIESIEYNITCNGYTSKSIASKYAIAIAQFYRYANQQNWFTNNDLLNHINMYRLDENSYYYKIGNYIKNNSKLSSKEPKSACNNNEINDLISTIDAYFDKYSSMQEKISFSKVCGMLAIKLIILTGAKYSVIRKLKYSNLNTKVNTLKINGYTIRLPINLSYQFQICDEIRQSTLNKSSDFLFCSQNGDQWKGTSPNSNIVDFLSVVILRQDTTGIAKFGISNLLKAGISIAEIEKLTEAKSDIIRGCMSSDIESEENKMNKFMNMRLSSIDYFYKL